MPFYRYFFRTKSVSQTNQRRMKTIWTCLLFAVVTFWSALRRTIIQRRVNIVLPYQWPIVCWLRLASMRKRYKGVKIKQMRDRLCFFC